MICLIPAAREAVMILRASLSSEAGSIEGVTLRKTPAAPVAAAWRAETEENEPGKRVAPRVLRAWDLVDEGSRTIAWTWWFDERRARAAPPP